MSTPPAPSYFSVSGSGETWVIQQFIKPGAIVFDVGANVGNWSTEVLRSCPTATVHAFEPSPQIAQQCKSNWEVAKVSDRNSLNIEGLSWESGNRTYYYYSDNDELSTVYRRIEVERQMGMAPPQEMSLSFSTLDSYCAEKQIRHIDFLKIDVEGAELDVLMGGMWMISSNSVDFIQFEYGGTYLDADITLRQVFDLIAPHRYKLFEITPNGITAIDTFTETLENYQYSNFLWVNERFVSANADGTPMLDLLALCNQHGITPRGVIHIGAHLGEELPLYRSMGIARILYIEANPKVFVELQRIMLNEDGVTCINCAISDQSGSATLHVASMDQSSSILPFKDHLKYYPSITEESQVSVPAYTVDTLLEELSLDPADYNLLNIDIQGAELMALKGALSTLPHIDGINTEVNFEELYTGCPLIHEIDDFLNDHNFVRVSTCTPYHHSWGDAFYVTNRIDLP